MNLKVKDSWVVYINILISFFIIMLTNITLTELEWYVNLTLNILTILFSFVTMMCYFIKKPSLCKSLFIFNVIVLVIVAVFVILSANGIFKNFSDIDKIKQSILEGGNTSYIIYILVQILNVVFLPLPSFVVIILGVSLFGPIKAFFLTVIGVIIGSIISFMIGRFIGLKIVVWCIGKEKTQKYKNMIGSKGYLLFLIMQLLPFFPDDILCMVAGLTSMKFSFFIISMLIVKPIYIAIVCIFGTGSIIPFSGWGIPVWIAIILLLAIIFALFCKYEKNIVNWFKRIGK